MVKKLFLKTLVLLITLHFACAYYNTMFNAIQNYNQGMDKIETSKDGQISSAIQTNFNATIDKCWKLINIQGDSSKYADDALLLIGKSHYQLEQYTQAQRILDQFVNGYIESPLIHEANLWLARSEAKLLQYASASQRLNQILNEQISDDLATLTWFTLGNIYFEQDNSDNAIEAFENCIQVSNEDKISAQAQYLLGNVYYFKNELVKAIENYDAVRKFNAPLKIEIDSQFKKVDAQIELHNYDMAIKTLQTMLSESRFTDIYPTIEARIGDCYRLQNNIEFATQQYTYTIQNSQRTEGAALATFGLAQIMEHDIADIDSASKLYLRVKQENRQSTLVAAADSIARILQNYLKIKQNISVDIADLELKNTMDSTEVTDRIIESFESDEAEVIDTTKVSKADSIKMLEEQKLMEKRLKRTVEEIELSLDKNRYALAEFFLLNMQNFDSASYAYKNFIAVSTDSILVPKAYYSLYYIYTFEQPDSITADSIKNIIIENYSESPYAEYINDKERFVQNQEEKDVNQYGTLYNEGESLLFNELLPEALTVFHRIAEEDSGGIWGEKSRYAIAWTYEHKLKDIPKAIDAYAEIVKEYPQSKIAKIAENKIKPPPADKEIKPEDDQQTTETTTQDSLNVKQEETKNLNNLEK